MNIPYNNYFENAGRTRLRLLLVTAFAPFYSVRTRLRFIARSRTRCLRHLMLLLIAARLPVTAFDRCSLPPDTVFVCSRNHLRCLKSAPEPPDTAFFLRSKPHEMPETPDAARCTEDRCTQSLSTV